MIRLHKYKTIRKIEKEKMVSLWTMNILQSPKIETVFVEIGVAFLQFILFLFLADMKFISGGNKCWSLCDGFCIS